MTEESNQTQYDSVVDMIRDIEGDAEADELKEAIAGRSLATLLFRMRNRRGMTQAEIADKMGCTQSAVSKLEHSDNRRLTVGDLGAYADALGLKLSLLFHPPMTIADQVKHHFFQIKRLLEQLSDLAGDDPEIVSGVRGFYDEYFVNTYAQWKRAVETLPSQSTMVRSGDNALEIETSDDSRDAEELGELVLTRRR